MANEKKYREVHSVSSKTIADVFGQSADEAIGWIKKTAKKVDATRMRVVNEAGETKATLPLVAAGASMIIVPLFTLASFGLAVATGCRIIFEKEDTKTSGGKLR